MYCSLFTRPPLQDAYKDSIFSILSINELEAIKAHNNEINRFKSEQLINPTADSRRTVTGQTLGNCSSRSIREALRDNIPDSEFREIYDFITQTQPLPAESR